MTHAVPYGISAETYDNLKALHDANIVDTCIVMHGGGAAPPTQFPIDAKAAGTSRLANNGNDGVGGWDGTSSYYPRMASLGYVGCGGESEQQAEIDSIMSNMIFIDMGGEGTPGGYQDDIWRVTHPGNVSGHGAACRFETYDSNSNFWGWNVIGQAVKDAASHGVKEIGILIGNWMLYHEALTECRASGEPIEKVYADKIKALTAVDEYIQLGKDIESNGYTFSGMWVWAGYGSNMNSLYQQFASWYQSFMAVWPADMRTMDVRYGSTPPPPPPQIPDAPAPYLCIGPDGALYEFVRGSDMCVWYRTPVTQWKSLGGSLSSNPAAATLGNDIYIFGRGKDKATTYYRTLTQDWKSMGGVATSGPGATSTSSMVYVTVRGNDKAAYVNSFDLTTKAWSGWKSLGGILD